MKIRTLLLLLLLSLSFIHCKKDKTTAPTDQFPVYQSGDLSPGYVEGIRSGQNWLASAAGIQHTDSTNYITVRALTYSEAGFRREKLSINKVPKKTGTYLVNSNEGVYDGMVDVFFRTLTDDGDVGDDRFVFDTTATDNFVEVIEYDSTSNTMKGRFTLSFILSPIDIGRDNPNYPDAIRFTDGVFDVQIFE